METVGNLTVEQARDMISGIDTSPIPECRDFDAYTETDVIWRMEITGTLTPTCTSKHSGTMKHVTGKPSGRAPCTCLKAISPTASNSS